MLLLRLAIVAAALIEYGTTTSVDEEPIVIDSETLKIIREAMQRPNLWGGDMILEDLEEDKPVAGFQSNPSFTYWPNGIMHYQFNTSQGTGFNQMLFDEAIAEIESKTCIKIRHRSGSDANVPSYVMVTALNEGCYAYLGMRTSGGPRQLNLQPNGCWYKGIIIHELLHSLGFLHEHQRYDRDDYILVNMTNVQPSQVSQFTLISQASTNPVGVMPYDINSIMHYEWNAFGISQALQTIFVKNNPTFKIQHIVTRPVLSINDAAMINAVYNCSASTTSTTSTSTTSSTTGTSTTPTTTSTSTTPSAISTSTTTSSTTTSAMDITAITDTTTMTLTPRILKKICYLWFWKKPC